MPQRASQPKLGISLKPHLAKQKKQKQRFVKKQGAIEGDWERPSSTASH